MLWFGAQNSIKLSEFSVASVDTINLQSLNMVRNELVATIETAAGDIEKFLESGQEDGTSLQSCIDGVKQIVGTLKLIQFPEAVLLSEELLAATNEIAPGNNGVKFESKLEVISSTFFVLSRYLEYVQQVEKRTPVLLIPHINSLRKLHQETPYPECHFSAIALDASIVLPDVDSVVINDKKELRVYIRRARHMYQVGLLGFVREQQLANSTALMRRALIKLWRVSGNDNSLTILWWLSEVTLEAFAACDMSALETRKFLFMRLDRIIKQYEQAGEAALSASPPRGLLKELLYLIALSGFKSDDVQLIMNTYQLKRFAYTDQELTREHNALYGPSVHTVHSLVKVLQGEIIAIKRVLENTSQSSTQQIDDLDAFVDTLSKIAEIMNLVGLVTASSTLKEQLHIVKSWTLAKGKIDPEEMNEVANTLLFVESAVQGLEHSKLSHADFVQANSLAQKQTVAFNELASAKRIALEESEAGIALAKRAISSFAESGYDIDHIRNIAKTLTSVRGAMTILNNSRAQAVLEKSVRFVQDVLLDQDPPAALQELLETFADVIIAMEYYLDTADIHCKLDDTVLQVAEDGLDALGYGVASH